MDQLWPNLDKEVIIKSVIEIIEMSNMKRPVSLSTELLKKLSKKMEEQDGDRLIKLKIMNDTFRKLFTTQANKEYKIRRNPETRLVLHALYLHEASAEKVRIPRQECSISTILFVLAFADLGCQFFTRSSKGSRLL